MDEECIEDERWWIFYYLINKEKKNKMLKRAKWPPFFIKNTWFTNFKLQDPYENLNLINHTCVLQKW